MTNKRNSYLAIRCIFCGASLHLMAFRYKFICFYFSPPFFSLLLLQLLNKDFTSVSELVIYSDSFKVILICVTGLLTGGEVKVHKFNQITSYYCQIIIFF